MNFEFFIAKRVFFRKPSKDSVSSPIIKIAISAIAIGIVMMLVAIATGMGLRDEIRKKIASLNGHIQIYNYDTNRSEVSVNPIEKRQNFYPDWTNFLPKQISYIQPIINKAGIIRTESTFEGIIAKGVDKNYHWNSVEKYLVQGRLPNFISEQTSDEIIISQHLANRLGLKVNDFCNTLFLNEVEGKIPSQRNFKIVGIYNSGFYQFDELFIFVDMRHLQKINKWTSSQIGAFEVFIKDFEQIQIVNEQISQNISSFLDNQSIEQKYATIFEWFETFDINIAIIIAVMILVGGVNMITAVLVLILERTPMIGTLKSLGATNWSIRKIFLYNAIFLVSSGLFLGNFIGIGLLLIQKYFSILKLDASIYYVSEVPVYLNMGHIVILNVGVLILCVMMLIIPSYIVSKISPVKSMKLE